MYKEIAPLGMVGWHHHFTKRAISICYLMAFLLESIKKRGDHPAKCTGHITESYFSISCTVKTTVVFHDYD